MIYYLHNTWRRGTGSWSTEGCWLHKTNRSTTICKCNHLTHFAVLSNAYDQKVYVMNFNRIPFFYRIPLFLLDSSFSSGYPFFYYIPLFLLVPHFSTRFPFFYPIPLFIPGRPFSTGSLFLLGLSFSTGSPYFYRIPFF